MKEIIKTVMLTLLISGATIGLGIIIAIKMYQPRSNITDVNREDKIVNVVE